MHTLKRILLSAVSLMTVACSSPHEELYLMIDSAFKNAESRYLELADDVLKTDHGKLPHSLKEDGSLTLVSSKGWTSGFFPGSLWYIYEYTANEQIKARADVFTSFLENERHNTGTHDIGFMVYCSYGNSHRLFPSEEKTQIMLDAADALCSRFSPVTGCIKSWDHKGDMGWFFPVIIDNMMNLELLLWAWQHTGDSKYLDVATTHANTTMKNHFREDHSTYHVVNYDPETGDVAFKGTFQGLSDDSSWSRGQGWGLYGYTVMYRFTNDPVYLKKAQDIARYIMSYKPMPEDKIFLWDYKAPSDSPRDASAAALCASALLELSLYADDKVLADESYDYAVQILKSLSGPEYTAAKGQNGGFLLMHSVTSYPADREIDKPLCYADYYYLEALLRLKNILDNDKR